MSNKKSAIDTKLIGQLADLLTASDLSEIEVEEGDLRIRLAKESVIQNVSVAAPVAAPAPVAPAPAPAPAAAPAASAPAAASSGNAVTSPMVGTAYLSPAPGADPFVTVGQSVKKGQTILIVEAMKTMNQIPSPSDGVVTSISVEDGQPVEFGETLIILD